MHEKVAAGIDSYDGAASFDLVTMRMVAEHIERPQACVQSLSRALRPGGIAVVYTVFGGSPMPLLTRLAPMGLRHVVKSWLWGTQPKDTFPTCFKMNSRSALQRLFAGVGMREEALLRLDDCRTFARFLGRTNWNCGRCGSAGRSACHIPSTACSALSQTVTAAKAVQQAARVRRARGDQRRRPRAGAGGGSSRSRMSTRPFWLVWRSISNTPVASTKLLSLP